MDGRSCVQGAQQYFVGKMTGELKDLVEAFKEAKRVVEIAPTAADLGSLQVFPFLSNTSVIEGLKEELPGYLALAAEIEPIDWWKRHESDLPKWSSAARQILLAQQSSAAAERVFSLLNSSFGDKKHHILWKTILRPLYSYSTIIVNYWTYM